MPRDMTIACRACKSPFTHRTGWGTGRPPVVCSPACRAADAERLRRERSGDPAGGGDLAPHIATAPPPPPSPRRERALRANRVRQEGDRRRGLDPVTSEPAYTPDEEEFLRAVERYKREARRPFPTLRELHRVLLSLGYRKAA